MRNLSRLLGPVASLALVACLIGCTTSKQKHAVQQKEQMLQTAGFKLKTATTADQRQMLEVLPADRVSAVRSRGEVYFVYPVRSRNAFYVGKNQQYLAYQQAAQATAEDAMVKAEMESIKRSMSGPGWEAPVGDWDTE
jgi:hypothetical protein